MVRKPSAQDLDRVSRIRDTPIQVSVTESFNAWLAGLRDGMARVLIADRIDRIAAGNLGDHKSLGNGVHELRLNHGPGYRLYFARHGQRVIFLLCGGDKGSQDRDIRTAQAVWKRLKEKMESDQ